MPGSIACCSMAEVAPAAVQQRALSATAAAAPLQHGWPSCFLRLQQQQWPRQWHNTPAARCYRKAGVVSPLAFLHPCKSSRKNSYMSAYYYYKGLRSMRFVLYQVLCSPILLRASVQVHSLFSPLPMVRTTQYYDLQLIDRQMELVEHSTEGAAVACAAAWCPLQPNTEGTNNSHPSYTVLLV